MYFIVYHYHDLVYLIICLQRRKMTALMFAAQEGHLEILNKLIQNGANTHMKNEVCHYNTSHYFVVPNSVCWTLDIRWKTIATITFGTARDCTSQE